MCKLARIESELSKVFNDRGCLLVINISPHALSLLCDQYEDDTGQTENKQPIHNHLEITNYQQEQH